MDITDQYKYLGHIIANDLHDDADISRQTRSLYARANMLLRKFSATQTTPSAAPFMGASSGLILSKSLFVAYMLPSIMPYTAFVENANLV